MRRSRILGLSLVALLGLTLLAYAPGLSGPFVLDDAQNIVGNAQLRLEQLDIASLRDAAFSSSNVSPTGRPLAMLSFALNGYAFGWEALGFKVVNLFIHLINGLLVFALSLCLCRQVVQSTPTDLGLRDERGAAVWIAWLVAAIWLLHPIQLTAVLYVVQRMASMSALPVLGALLFYVRWRGCLERDGPVWPLFAALLVGAGVGASIKENAVLVVPLAAVIEFTLYSRHSLNARQRRQLYLGFALLLGGPLVVVVAATVTSPTWLLGGYEHRDFSIGERVLTQTRALFYYLSLMGWPELGRFGIYHDHYVVSRGLFSPPLTAVAVVGWLVALAAGIFCRARAPVLAFGLGWYLTAHALESSVIALELVFEHRNYLALLGPAFVCVWYARLGLVKATGRRVRVLATFAVLSLLVGLTAARANVWRSATSLIEFAWTHHPASARANVAAGFGAIQAGLPVNETMARFARAIELDKQAVLPLIEMAKILDGLAKLRNSTPVNGAWPVELPPDREAIAALIERNDREFRLRLQRFPIKPDSVYALKKLQECIRSRHPVCLPLKERALTWHQLALDNERVTPFGRAVLQFSLAELHVFRGDIDAALLLARRATALDHPGAAGFGLALVDLCLRLELWADAERALVQLEERIKSHPFMASDVRAARALFTRLRRKES